MTQSLTKISVIIPVYNAENTIGQCIESILANKIDGLEIICVDDGSKDRSIEIIKKYRDKNKEITLLTQNNQFAGVARNNGLAHATGEYVAFLDADDTFLPGALARMLKIAKKHKLDMFKAGFAFLDTTNDKSYKTLFSTNSMISLFDKMRILTLKDRPVRLLNAADVPWNGIYKRSFLAENDIRFNDLQCVNDHSFYIHCLLKAKRIKFSSFPVVCYRVGQNNSLIGKKASRFENQIASYNIVKKLVADEEKIIKHAVMEKELYLVLDWYTTLLSIDKSQTLLNENIKAFVSNFDESDVSPNFTKTFAYSDVYHRLRYGKQSSGKQGKFKKALNCYREHGIKYTIAKLIKRER